MPYAVALASLIDPAAVRLRRDFPTLLTLVEAHALVHQNHRERDERNRVIATICDYAEVHRLTADLIAEGAARSIKPTIRETVLAVSQLQFGHGGPVPNYTDNPVSIHKLAAHLGLEPSAARRRAYAAIDAGYLANTAQPRRPMALTVADTMPEQKAILPTPDELEDACSRARTTDG